MFTTHKVSGQVSDTTFQIPIGIPSSKDGIFSITFYSDEYQTPIKPTSGTAKFEVSEDSFNYGSVTNGTITYPSVDGYDRPHYYGYAGSAQVTLAGIQGATHFTARLHMG